MPVPFESLAFSDAEALMFGRVFDKLSQDGVARGARVTDLLKSSQLDTATLGDVWALADRNNKGYLERVEFFVAMRAIGLLQHGADTVSAEKVAATKLSLESLPSLDTEVRVTPEEVREAVRARVRQSPRSAFPDPAFHVTVGPPQKVGSHTTYEVVVVCTDGLLDDNQFQVVVTKRFSDFERFRNQLLVEAPGHVIPALPAKNSSGWLTGSHTDAFLKQRQQDLETLLNRVLADPVLRVSPTVLAFVQGKDLRDVRAPPSARKIDVVVGKYKPPDDRVVLEDVSASVSKLQAALAACGKRLNALASQHQVDLAHAHAFLVTVVPPALPLSQAELQTHHAELARFFETHTLQAMEGCARDVRGLLDEAKLLREAYSKAKFTEQQANAAANPESMQRFQAAKVAIQEQQIRFQLSRESVIRSLLLSVINAEREYVAFKATWWERLYTRLLFAHAATSPQPLDPASPFAGRAQEGGGEGEGEGEGEGGRGRGRVLPVVVDVPPRVLCFRELSWFPAGVVMRVEDVINEVRFQVGQEAATTLPAPQRAGEPAAATHPADAQQQQEQHAHGAVKSSFGYSEEQGWEVEGEEEDGGEGREGGEREGEGQSKEGQGKGKAGGRKAKAKAGQLPAYAFSDGMMEGEGHMSLFRKEHDHDADRLEELECGQADDDDGDDDEEGARGERGGNGGPVGKAGGIRKGSAGLPDHWKESS